MSLFEQASRQKLRFESPKGELTSEQLWDLPLTSENKASLDGVIRGINRQLKDLSEDSFVDVRPNPRRSMLQLQFDIVKRVIEVRQQENADSMQASERAAQRAKLQEILNAKKDAELQNLSVEEIEARMTMLNS